MVRGLLSACHNAYNLYRDRNDPDGGSYSEMDSCSAGSVDIRRVAGSAPCTPGPECRRTRSQLSVGCMSSGRIQSPSRSSPTQSTSQLFSQVDKLFDGSESDRERAISLLQAQEQQVSSTYF